MVVKNISQTHFSDASFSDREPPPKREQALTKTMQKVVLLILAIAAIAASSAVASETDSKPNILLILADDLGYADLGCQGSTDVVSPHIDSIAANGVRFTQGYVSAPQCVPSRAGLMTARDQNRFGAESNLYGHTFGDERTLAESLKDAGYVTGMAGKWHGHEPGDRPFDRGFDECFWNNGGGILFPDPNIGLRKNHFRNAEPEQEREYSTDAYGREAAAFIDRHAGGEKPFLYFLSFVPPHWPMEAKAEHLKRFAHVRDLHRRTMLAMMASMDENIGKVLAKIREKGVEENTLILFLSDNGGPTGNPRTDPDAPFQHGQNTSRNEPLRGMKGNLLEGGIRVPFLLQWKSILPKGVVYEKPVTAFDIGATALALAGVKAEPALDGVNLMPFLLGKQEGLPHERLFWRFRFDPDGKYPRQWAVREGDWKLVQAWHEEPALYNLAADVAENDNRIEQEPEIAARLRDAYLAWEKQVDREQREQNLPKAEVPRRPTLGVIRWDMYTGHPFTTQKQEFGFLKPEKYHWRAPFFVRRTGNPEKPLAFNPDNRPEAFQKAMEQEIDFAARAGIDYWAFGYHGPGNRVRRGLHEGIEAFLASPRKQKIRFCPIVFCPGVAAVEFYEPPSVRHTEAEIDASWEEWVADMIKLAKEPSHQRVLNGRPLVYLYQPRFLGEGRRRDLAPADRVDRCLRFLREQFNAAGVGNPYLAHMVDTRKPAWEGLFDQGLVDCVTLYHHRYAGDNLQYGTLWGHIHRSVLHGTFKRAGLKVIPPTMSGANGMPRYTGPGGAFPKWDWTEPAPGELAAHLTGAFDYVAAHPGKCEANTVIMYAWNEHSEGGFLCPTMGEAPDYQPVTRQLDEVAAALKAWKPKTAKPKG